MLYSKPSAPASFENSFIDSSVFSPPSRYFQTARPGRTHSVANPFGKSVLSGGGETLWMMSQFTSASRSAPIIMTRQGVVIVPSIAAGFERRSISDFGYLSSYG